MRQDNDHQGHAYPTFLPATKSNTTSHCPTGSIPINSSSLPKVRNYIHPLMLEPLEYNTPNQKVYKGTTPIYLDLSLSLFIHYPINHQDEDKAQIVWLNIEYTIKK
jgi:hypothetical protein